MQEDKLSRAVDLKITTDRMHRCLIASRVKGVGVHRTQHRILMILSRLGKLPSQKELAEHLEITPAAVTGAIKVLENAGYVERNLGHDTRFMELVITEKGRAVVEETKKMFAETDKSLFAGFTDDELDIYIRCLEKLQSNIRLHIESGNELK